MNNYHKSVLLQEAIDLLNIEPEKKYIDGTLGGGGHTGAILDKGGEVLGIDFDDDALDFVKENLKFQISNLKLKLAGGNFKDIDKIAKEQGFEKVSGIVFDLGVSSHHFDAEDRGFSIQKTGPLDMRMDRNLGVKASDLVNGLTKGELYELFNKFGEERFARTICESIISARKIKPIQTTTELADIIRRAVPGYKSDINPATRVFQALRIAVNDELNNIRESLPKAIELLESHGRLAVISFHSLEDRIIKNAFKEFEAKGLGKIVTKKPIVPTEEEIEANNRSRSAKLRVFEKI
jgi:16S rRNA (cytosine1402-N4)-methyltransferase